MHEKYYEEYLYLLKKFRDYSPEKKEKMDFNYQSCNDINLRKLRNKYNLMEVAGDGNEVSRILNLFNWFNKNTIHDGSIYPKGDRNAIDILKQCINDEEGVNCRLISIAMNEVFLSMGFKSRYITCRPIGFDFTDCHVVNVIYSYDLDKWVFLDASMGIYCKENNELLSLQELGQAIIEDKEITINEAYYDGELVTKKDYFKYMTKNLFQLDCYSNYEFNFESNNTDKIRYFLNPMDYFNKDKIIYTQKDNYTIEEHYVSCANEFWKKP
ncbi:transglutaminase-like domain-containing protein [Vallitalea longa]|nr:transglutaminase-like domain-containing protein [Vallitalea longa]